MTLRNHYNKLNYLFKPKIYFHNQKQFSPILFKAAKDKKLVLKPLKQIGHCDFFLLCVLFVPGK